MTRARRGRRRVGTWFCAGRAVSSLPGRLQNYIYFVSILLFYLAPWDTGRVEVGGTHRQNAAEYVARMEKMEFLPASSCRMASVNNDVASTGWGRFPRNFHDDTFAC